MEKFGIIQYNRVMYYRRTHYFWQILTGQLGVGLIIAVAAFGIIYFAQGYRFNIKSFKIIKTGLVNVISSPRDASVYIDGKLKSSKTPYYLNLPAGYHSVEIKKNGFVDWQTTYLVEPEIVTDSKNIILVKKEIVPTVLTDQKKIKILHESVDLLAKNLSNDLSYNDHEIWIDNQLVARFSQPIDHLVWFSDNAHLVYQQGNQIRMIEDSGKNDTLLVTMKNKNITNIVFGANRAEMYYTDGVVDMMAVIR